ncbi:hypothetical protein D3981_003062 [Escherichia coli]|nr:hypothetical protein [Escherichia coli]
MYKQDRDNALFNLINEFQPVYRNNGGGEFEFDRQEQYETSDAIFKALTQRTDYEAMLKQMIRIKSVRRIAQFDDGTVRYGVHVEFHSHVKINAIRIFKEDKQDRFDIYFFDGNADKAELVFFNFDVHGIHLNDVFEQRTGLLLS